MGGFRTLRVQLTQAALAGFSTANVAEIGESAIDA
jgi:hypothetical protein